MTATTVTQLTRSIQAPVDRVFRTVADIREFSKAIPHLVEFEFLTEQQSGVGTRFRETRLMGGKEAQTELEVTEYVENDRVRLIADSHGAVWDTLFTVEDRGDHTVLGMNMEARPHQLMAKMMIPVTKRLISAAVEKDIEVIKAYCENRDHAD